MPRSDDRTAFAASYAAGRPFVVWRRSDADLVTTVAAYLKLKAGRPGPAFLLESVEGGAVRGRYSIIGIDPDLIWRAEDGACALNPTARSDPHAFEPCAEPVMDSLRRLIAENVVDLDDELPPMATGLFGYLGYDMVRHMERLGPPKPDGLRQVPTALLIRPRTTVIFDHVRDEISIIRLVRPEPGGDVEEAYAGAQAAIGAVLAALAQPLPPEQRPGSQGGDPAPPVPNVGAEQYGRMIEAAKEHIAAGDIFQVVLSQRFEVPFALPAFELYRSLRRINPAPFLCYLDFDEFQLVCSSPEILVSVRAGTVTVRPIAGTRPRGATPQEDQRLADELLSDPKERAEHLMLLDLGRNDVGRVAELGSVAVTESFAIERYSQVMHIVSNVEGQLRPDRDALDALVAGFPAGTVSGAPKIRAMQIIDELEPEGRGPYGGCIGYFGPNGDMDTCIVLRTGLVKDGRLSVQAGAGIVYDSDPAAEAEECVNKAKALFRAADDALARNGQR